MTRLTRTRATNDAVEQTGGHDTMSLLSAEELKAVTHMLIPQTPMATLLIVTYIYRHTHTHTHTPF